MKSVLTRENVVLSATFHFSQDLWSFDKIVDHFQFFVLRNWAVVSIGEKLISLKKLFVTLKQKFYLYFFFPPTNCLSLFTCRERPICEDRFLNCDILPRAPWQLLHGVEPNFHFQDKATCSASFGGYEAYFKMHMCPNCCKSFVPFAQVLIPGLPRLISCPPSGLEDYIKRYGEGIRRVLTSFGPVPDFAGEGAKSIINVSVMAAKETML